MEPEDPGQNSGIEEAAPGNAGSQRFKANNNAYRGNDYLWDHLNTINKKSKPR